MTYVVEVKQLSGDWLAIDGLFELISSAERYADAVRKEFGHSKENVRVVPY